MCKGRQCPVTQMGCAAQHYSMQVLEDQGSSLDHAIHLHIAPTLGHLDTYRVKLLAYQSSVDQSPHQAHTIMVKFDDDHFEQGYLEKQTGQSVTNPTQI